jgi:hypothetical protein
MLTTANLEHRHPAKTNNCFDDGLDHGHAWAMEAVARHGRERGAADASAVPLPSTVLHDDAHYAPG